MASCSAIVLTLINTLFVILGAVITGVMAFVVKHKGDLEDLFAPQAAEIIMSAGILLMIVGILGCLGAKFMNKGCGRCVLVLYCVSVFVILCLQVGGAIVFLNAIGELNDVAGGGFNKSANSFVEDTYEQCCGVNTTQPVPPMIPTVKECWVWELDHSLVTDSTCQNLNTFKGPFIDWLKGKLHPIAIVALSFAAVQLLAMFVTCCVIYRGKQQQRDQERQPYASFPDLGARAPGSYGQSGFATQASLPAHSRGRGPAY